MIKLEYFNESDFPQFIKWCEQMTEAELFQWAGSELVHPIHYEKLKAYIEGANSAYSERYIYRVVDLKLNKVIGHLQLAAVNHSQSNARISRVLIADKSLRGKGYGQQIILRACRIIFDQFGLHRASLGVFDFNVSAVKCYEKIGFKQEGLLREARKVGDVYWNLYEMGMLEHEWMSIKSSWEDTVK
ncbi:Protein N-acetyltransferase, RimJ/RimL family [Amphibacillus marinus]|uniref:Protein N-acetyltransferase, RimJ/RimL family n=1 Tax=Amphibacillus marinus TaxID=872970 RepID=A0A1H8MCX1_9BACI|nr:GNAT family protein [Amphibacillus marinus]SEO15144.1 Protein N-acetyltransferase, RimJ/RimL family [Amphibacillus marinus]